MIERIVHS